MKSFLGKSGAIALRVQLDAGDRRISAAQRTDTTISERATFTDEGLTRLQSYSWLTQLSELLYCCYY
jgi:hypothetical protein